MPEFFKVSVSCVVSLVIILSNCSSGILIVKKEMFGYLSFGFGFDFLRELFKNSTFVIVVFVYL